AGGLLASVTALRELVDDLTDIARFDLGSMPLRLSRVPLAPFLAGTLELPRRLAGDKGLAFALDVEPAGLAAWTGPDLLARVVGNLASNAVKFTDAGSVRVAARAAPGGGLVLAVADTGRGIAPESHRAIFDEFAQLQNPEGDRAKGTGLGLALCRRLISAVR